MYRCIAGFKESVFVFILIFYHRLESRWQEPLKYILQIVNRRTCSFTIHAGKALFLERFNLSGLEIRYYEADAERIILTVQM